MDDNQHSGDHRECRDANGLTWFIRICASEEFQQQPCFGKTTEVNHNEVSDFCDFNDWRTTGTRTGDVDVWSCVLSDENRCLPAIDIRSLKQRIATG